MDKEEAMAKKLKDEITHDQTCDICGAPAEYNLQTEWQLWAISDNGDYMDMGSWPGDTNKFYCEECAKEEEII